MFIRMDKTPVFASSNARRAWEQSGSPYCEHPSFLRDGNGYGSDEIDWHCTTCGALKVGRDGPTPPSAGTRPAS